MNERHPLIQASFLTAIVAVAGIVGLAQRPAGQWVTAWGTSQYGLA